MAEPQTQRVPRSRAPLLLLIAIALAAGLPRCSGSTRAVASARRRRSSRAACATSRPMRARRARSRASRRRRRATRRSSWRARGRLAESQSQQLALEALYQELSRNRDEWQLAEIEQVLAIASQQLQLAGNVRAALLALQLAEARLAKSDRPQFLPVRRALARDIERLKALPVLDVAGMSARIDGMVAAVDTLPLAFDERSERPAAAAKEAGGQGVLVAARRGSVGRAAPAGGDAPGRRERGAAAAAAAGLFPAREPAPAPAQRAPVAADARRGRLSRGPARGAGLDPALLRRAQQAGRGRAGAAEAASADLDQLRDADHLGEPGGGARLPVAPVRRSRAPG